MGDAGRDGGVEPRRRCSSRVAAASDEIETALYLLRRIFRQFDATDLSDWRKLFPAFLQCEREASNLIATIRRTSARVHVGNARREEVEAELVKFERLQLRVCRREIGNILEIIEKVGAYVPPAVVGRGAQTCQICQEESAFRTSGRVVLRDCGSRQAPHAMCSLCAFLWFVVQGESTCPFCRWDYEARFGV